VLAYDRASAAQQVRQALGLFDMIDSIDSQRLAMNWKSRRHRLGAMCR
jgi:hypothetical protein